jgi:hypothetical protein
VARTAKRWAALAGILLLIHKTLVGFLITQGEASGAPQEIHLSFHLPSPDHVTVSWVTPVASNEPRARFGKSLDLEQGYVKARTTTVPNVPSLHQP